MKTIGSLIVSFGVLCAYIQNVSASDVLDQSQARESGGSPGAATRSGERPQRTGRMEEVIVTAQKRGDERLQDVPVPVSVLSAPELLANGATTLQDYYSRIPGVAITSGLGGTSTVVVRGVATNGLNDNPTVGVMIDDAPYGLTTYFGGGLQPIDMDPNELKQIEVLRGPQGTLYGASSIGGLMRYVLTEPSLDEFSGRVMVSSQSARNGDGFDYGIRGSMNLPVGSSVAVRASGFDTQQAGYIDDTFSGQKGINDSHSYGGRVAMLWRANDDWSFKFSALRQVLSTDAANLIDLDPAAVGDERLESSDYVPHGAGANRSVSMFNGVIEGSISDIKLTSITAYTSAHSLQREPFTRGLFFTLTRLFVPSADAGLYRQAVENSKFSQEFRASIPINDKIDWMVGAFYTEEDGDYQTESISSARRATGEIIDYGDLLDAKAISEYTEVAAFTNLTVRFTDRVDVQFGGRLSENRQKVFQTQSGILTGDTVAGPNRSKDQPFTYLVTPRWKVNDDWMIYARVASGYRPGGPSFNSTLPGAPDSLKADTTENYELGIKTDLFEQLLSFDVSGYYIDWKDIPIGVQSAPGSPLGYLINAGKAISKGVEISFALRPLEGLTLSAWGAWNDAYIAELPENETSTLDEGDRLPFSAKFSTSGSIEYTHPLSQALDWSVGASLRYVGKRSWNPGAEDDIPQNPTPSYKLIDAHIGFTSESWSVSAFVNNLTDERARVGGKALDIFSLPTSTLITRPRTIGLSVTKSF